MEHAAKKILKILLTDKPDFGSSHTASHTMAPGNSDWCSIVLALVLNILLPSSVQIVPDVLNYSRSNNREGVPNKVFLRGSSVPRSKSLPFYIPSLDRKGTSFVYLP